MFSCVLQPRSRSSPRGSANCVGLAKQRHRNRIVSPPAKAWGWVQWLTVGYGYRAGALIWLFGLILLGGFVFQWVQRPLPSDDPHPPFQSFVYAADLLIPVLNLGLTDSFVPDGWWALLAWTLRAAGWILTTALVADVARLLNRPAGQ